MKETGGDRGKQNAECMARHSNISVECGENNDNTVCIIAISINVLYNYNIKVRD